METNQSTRAFLLTGGEVFPDLVDDLPGKEDLIIAADAGYLTARKLGLSPSVLLGDFDTLGGVPRDLPANCEVLRYPAEKNDTDTQLAVDLAISRGAKEIIIIGGLNERLDHTLSAVSILEYCLSHRVRALITSGKNRVRLLHDDGIILPRSHFRYLSLIALSEKATGIHLDGVKYPLERAKLLRTRQWMISNEIVGNCALVEIRRGDVLVIESMD